MEAGKRTGAVVSALAAEVLGWLSGLFSGDMRLGYELLYLPPLSPPGWILSVVRVILFAMIGVAAWKILDSRCGRPDVRKRALLLYAALLFLHFWWSIFFFRWEMRGSALLILLLLIVLAFLTILAFHEIEPEAACLLLPYFVWTVFSTYLNIGINIMN